MNDWTVFFAFLAVGVATYAMRGGLIIALAQQHIPHVVERALANVGPAVLAALVVSLAAGGESNSLTLSEAAGLVTSGAAALWKRNLFLALVVGMTTLWIIEAVT